MLVGDGDATAAGPGSSGLSPPNINLTDEERRKVEDGEKHSTNLRVTHLTRLTHYDNPHAFANDVTLASLQPEPNFES